MAGADREVPLKEAARRLIVALNQAGVPYALGGALALGYHAPPRGTLDIDLNIFLPADDAQPALQAMQAAGLTIDVESAVRRASERGDAIGHFGSIRVDVFVNSIPAHEDAAERRQRVKFGDVETWILSAEDLAFLKLMFNRPKDLLDIQQMCFTLGADFDFDYVDRQLVAHLGQDARRETLKQLRDSYG